ncbi:MAG: hypothetical protein IT531_19395 [Burkholderiales bacterium]|nr:hypothetical protein [Burkholderiales bacterium]
MSTTASPYVRRLTLALDAGQCSEADIALAIELAALIGTELRGLFVEDSDLLRLAQLPFAREFGGQSGQDRRIEPASVESLLRRRVQHLADELERAGKQRNVPVSHKTARGKVVREALEHGERGDVVVLGRPGTVQRAARRRKTATAPGPVMVWYEDGPASGASCDIAIDLARQLGSGLLIGFPSRRFGSEADVRAQLAAWLRHAPAPVSLYGLADVAPDTLIAAARAAGAAQLVMTAQGSLANAEALERILAALGAGLILVR